MTTKPQKQKQIKIKIGSEVLESKEQIISLSSVDKIEMIQSIFKEIANYDPDNGQSVASSYLLFKKVSGIFDKWKKGMDERFEEDFGNLYLPPELNEDGSLRGTVVLDKDGETCMQLKYSRKTEYLPNAERLLSAGYGYDEVYELKSKNKIKEIKGKKITGKEFDALFDEILKEPKITIDKDYAKKAISEVLSSLK